MDYFLEFHWWYLLVVFFLLTFFGKEKGRNCCKALYGEYGST